MGAAPAPLSAPPKKRNKAAIWVAVGVAAALVLGTVGFLVSKSFTRGGASSPEAAASQLFQAVGDKNILGVAQLVAPSEFADIAAVQKANGSNTFDNFSPATLRQCADAIEVFESDVDYAVETKTDDIALITVDSWDLHASVNVEEFLEVADKQYEEQYGESPSLVSNFRELMESGGGTYEPVQTIDQDVLEGSGPITLVSVKENGSWYISPLMTAGEALVVGGGSLTSHEFTPDYRADYATGTGAASPTEAVEALGEAVVDGQNSGNWASQADELFGRLSFPERRFAMVYLGDALGDTGTSQEPVEWTPGFVETNLSDGIAALSPGRTSVSYRDGWGDRNTFDFDGWELAVSGPYDRVSVDFGRLLQDPTRVGIVTVKESGGWYVSALGTVADIATAQLDPAKVDQHLGPEVEELVESMGITDIPRDAYESMGPAAIFLDVMLLANEQMYDDIY